MNENPANPAAKNVHSSHRRRVRERFLKSGLDSFPDINVLEFLLFYSVPYGDTNVTAHRLLENFGSLSAVLDAPYEELLKVKGIGEFSATFLKLVPQLAKRYSVGKIPDNINCFDREALQGFLCSEFINETDEVIKLLCFNSSGVLVNCCRVSLGSKNLVHIDKRTLLETAFRNSATHVILSHNHPAGMAAPSQKDVDTTKEIFDIFRSVNIKLVDHIIVAGNSSFSFADSTKYCTMFI